MKEATPELSPDLEWMLQGRQASQALILETMVHEYANEVTRLTASILGNPSLALYAAFDTFAAVLENRHRYYGKSSVRLFIYSYAIEVSQRYLAEARAAAPAQAVDGLSAADETDALIGAGIAGLSDALKLPLILRLGARLTEDEIALVLRTRPKWVRIKLQKALGALEKNLPSRVWGGQPLEDALGAYLERHPQPPDLGDITQAQMIQAVEYALEKRKQTSQARAILYQSAMAMGVVFIMAVIGWITNRIAFRQTLPPLMAQTVIVTQIVHVPVYITPTPQMRRANTPLTINSSEDEIRQQIIESDSLWNTLWADASIYQYGPAGYVGFPELRREQIWISQPGRSVLIAGYDKVETGWLLSENKLIPLNIPIPESLNAQRAFASFRNQINTFLIFEPNAWARKGNSLSVVKEVNTLGRDALVVDCISKSGAPLGQATIDAQLGIALSIRLYDQDGFTVLADVYLNKLVVDKPLPEAIFDPTTRIEYFYQDYHAQEPDLEQKHSVVDVIMPGHEPYPKLTPSPGFNPSTSNLTLQWSKYPFGDNYRLTVAPVDIFADGYYLGQIEVGNPWSAICERSSDGRHLAIIEQPDAPPYPSIRIRLISLEALEEDHELLPGGSRYGSDLAFSPDSRYLAFWGCGGREDNCGVYLLNLSNQKLIKLLAGDYAGYFVWSPDGNELAMLREDDSLVVVDVKTGQITYQEYMDWVTFIVPPNAPVINWGVEFPPPRMGLQGCAKPGSN